jgi:hypothetical protein
VDRRLFVSRILLLDGVLLIVAAFIHLFSTSLVQQWLARNLSPDSLSSISLALVLNHLSIGILLIPFGMSTMYTAAGVRAGHKWAMITALTNGFAVLALPLLPLFLIGPDYFRSEAAFLTASVINAVVGVSIVVSLLWLIRPGKSLSRHARNPDPPQRP